MKWLKKYELFKEAKSDKSFSKNLISDICVSMCLLNNEFLDSLLNKGLSARYTENSQIFLTDLKNLIMSGNRLKVGKFIEGNKCVVDEDLGKINQIFHLLSFDVREDWSKLINARNTSRTIIDNIFPDSKLAPEFIQYVFLNINKSKDHKEDIVIETTDGKQFSFFLNKNIASQKSASFNLFADDLIGKDYEHLFTGEYINKWNLLTQEWIRIVYEGSNKNIQRHIEKFIDTKRIDSISYFGYFDIKHRDPRYKHLGEFIQELGDNYLKFSDLMNDIWKNKSTCFMNEERSTAEWFEAKNNILNSKIIEHLLTTSLKTTNANDIIKRGDEELKIAQGTVKMKLVKTLVEKLGCLERQVFFLSNNGNSFNQVPSRDFFRKNYNSMTIRFDYHVKFAIDMEDEEGSDFKFKIILDMDDKPLLEMLIVVKFTGSEFSGKLSAKYKFEIPEDFNYRVNQKILNISPEE